MAFLFRKLRYGNMKNASSLRYMKYAIGEIIIVVFGILIALQINNWNENRKTLKVEVGILKDIRNDILEKITNLEEGIIGIKEANIKLNKVITTPEKSEIQTLKSHITIARQQIRQKEYQLFFAENGAEALKKLNDWPDVDIVLSDIIMPEIDGLKPLSKLNELETLLKSVIVVYEILE